MSSVGIEIRILSSLTKVFHDEEPKEYKQKDNESVLKGEPFIFQIAYKRIGEEAANGGKHLGKTINYVRVCDKYKNNVTIRDVKTVPVRFPMALDVDKDYLRMTPGLYPDHLSDLRGGNKITISALAWNAMWVEFLPDDSISAGEHNIEIDILDGDFNLITTVSNKVKVIDASLPKQELMFTQWIHTDCIASYHNIEIFGERHFSLLEKYIKTAVDNGINMIYTPLFTPPLDTMVGGSRPTTQLVDVFLRNDKYSFKFDKLDRFIDICIKCGAQYFEMSHLFTQWGCEHVPKIVADVNSVQKQIFGWDDDSTGDKYVAFLDEFLPQLKEFLKSKGILNNCYFHISDEPRLEHLDKFKECASIVAKYLSDCKVLDALSNIDFYNTGAVPIPVPASNHIEPFLDKDIKERWVYYCISQGVKVSNRFIAMPSYRNRIISTQLYKFDIAGFLHWGYNFYYSQYSVEKIDPYQVVDSDFSFPAGDPFSVYPGEDGPDESLRIRVFYQALCDLRAFKLLESIKGKEFVMAIIEEGVDELSFSEYPRNDDYLIDLRIKINNAIAEAIK